MLGSNWQSKNYNGIIIVIMGSNYSALLVILCWWRKVPKGAQYGTGLMAWLVPEGRLQQGAQQHPETDSETNRNCELPNANRLLHSLHRTAQSAVAANYFSPCRSHQFQGWPQGGTSQLPAAAAVTAQPL